MTELEFRLSNEFQRDFPLAPQPFDFLAHRLATDEATVLRTLRSLMEAGVVSRVGAVFAPRRLGASTLAAMAVPPTRLEEVAELVSARAEVNHNYEREHRYNLWFVAMAGDAAALAALLRDIERETGCAVLSLPLEEEFYIDLGFELDPNLAGAGKAPCATRLINADTQRPLDAAEQAVMAALQEGLELVSQPYAALAARAGMSEAALLDLLRDWQRENAIKRFGVVVRHHELGYTANAMAVWDVPDADVHDLGLKLAAEADVTLCYRRGRHLPEWRYNLYCMIHGRERDDVETRIARLSARYGLIAYPHAVLFSLRRYKQRGARYVPVVEAVDG